MQQYRHLLSIVVLSVFAQCFTPNDAAAQAQAGRAGFGFNAGGAKYFGEFSDNSWWLGGDIFFRYNILDVLAIQAQFNYANPRYRIDVDNAVSRYTDYFGAGKNVGDRFPNGTLISDNSEERRNNTRIFSYEVVASYNILPSQRFNPYVFGGIGLMNFQVRPGLAGGAGLRLSPTGERGVGVLPGQEAGLYETGGLNGGVVFPVGAGFEMYLSEDLVLNGRVTYRFTSTPYLDDYNPGSMKEYIGNGSYGATLPAPANVTTGGNDNFMTLGLGFTYYVFGNADYDGDGITNAQERVLGTDENNPDSDGDGLPDGYEYSGSRKVPNGFTEDYIASLPDTRYRTNPLKPDTDGDGLTDKDELVIHKTNPTSVDTDADGLKDGEELSRKTDPNNPDSDGDGLFDGDEVNTHQTDPMDRDTDKDGLTDGAEVKEHNTNPKNVDTDNDGLRDGDEVNTYKTNPSKDDTDNDGLLDGDEVNQYKTDPLNVDTDGDGLQDGPEVKEYKSNPTKADTDGDGLTDGDEVLKYKTNPISEDSDIDGLKDGDEVKTYMTDPSKADTDGDGLNDGDEVLKYKTDPKNVDTDDDGLKDGDEVNTHKTNPTNPDTDGDTLKDGDEISRTKTNPLNPDTDDDGVRDNVDKCPLIAGVPPDGCPPKPKPNTVTDFPGVLFIVNTDNFDLSVPGTMESLNKIYALVQQCPDLRVEIEGHASSEGNATRNQELSDLRAAAVKNWLVNQGVDAAKIVKTIGYGSSQPRIAEPKKGSKDQIEAARKQNRRIALRVVETCK